MIFIANLIRHSEECSAAKQSYMTKNLYKQHLLSADAIEILHRAALRSE
jgi:hypothetical protein